MSALLTADTIIRDREVLRWDWDGSPRFYVPRIYPHDPRECPAHPHLYTPQVKVRVELEGDPSAWSEQTTEDHPDTIRAAVLDCIGEIEDLCSDEWDREQDRQHRRDVLDYWSAVR